ncbi:uncharacterized protein LOC131931523 [Physella acuta]|uniref:uncharacterized protein LOC131931523 n=1 Tax=Physella acuta TaxID=109671 RepID=UPI0027DB150A|nr:uncharacterized protein LOC131931523 [Physella acuta]
MGNTESTGQTNLQTPTINKSLYMNVTPWPSVAIYSTSTRNRDRNLANCSPRSFSSNYSINDDAPGSAAASLTSRGPGAGSNGQVHWDKGSQSGLQQVAPPLRYGSVANNYSSLNELNHLQSLENGRLTSTCSETNVACNGLASSSHCGFNPRVLAQSTLSACNNRSSSAADLPLSSRKFQTPSTKPKPSNSSSKENLPDCSATHSQAPKILTPACGKFHNSELDSHGCVLQMDSLPSLAKTMDYPGDLQVNSGLARTPESVEPASDAFSYFGSNQFGLEAASSYSTRQSFDTAHFTANSGTRETSSSSCEFNPCVCCVEAADPFHESRDSLASEHLSARCTSENYNNSMEHSLYSNKSNISYQQKSFGISLSSQCNRNAVESSEVDDSGGFTATNGSIAPASCDPALYSFGPLPGAPLSSVVCMQSSHAADSNCFAVSSADVRSSPDTSSGWSSASNPVRFTNHQNFLCDSQDLTTEENLTATDCAAATAISELASLSCKTCVSSYAQSLGCNDSKGYESRGFCTMQANAHNGSESIKGWNHNNHKHSGHNSDNLKSSTHMHFDVPHPDLIKASNSFNQTSDTVSSVNTENPQSKTVYLPSQKVSKTVYVPPHNVSKTEYVLPQNVSKTEYVSLHKLFTHRSYDSSQSAQHRSDTSHKRSSSESESSNPKHINIGHECSLSDACRPFQQAAQGGSGRLVVAELEGDDQTQETGGASRLDHPTRQETKREPGKDLPFSEHKAQENSNADEKKRLVQEVVPTPRRQEMVKFDQPANDMLSIFDGINGKKKNYVAYLCCAAKDLETFGISFHRMIEDWGFQIFLAPRDLVLTGPNFDNMSRVLEERCNGKIIVILSENYASSDECMFLTSFARVLDPDSKKRNIIPVQIDKEIRNFPNVLKGLSIIRYNHDYKCGWLKNKLVEAIAA